VFAERCFDGLERSRMWDVHVHLIGLGAGGTGCSVNPRMLSELHPIQSFQFDAYRAASGIGDPRTADADYVARLLALHREMNAAGRRVLLAFDHAVAEDGTEQPDLSPFHTPDEYVLRVAREHAEFAAGVSIHPYRQDAVERLDRAIAAGAVLVKWLPNAMGIDPASPLCDRFYGRLAETGLPLLTHAGKEYAVEAGQHQDLGNPLRLRRALEMGVRVIVAHCASLGSFRDLDAPGQPSTSSFDLFMRLAADPRYRTNLHADISTLTQVHHDSEQLRRLLRATELHGRLLYGSDYPLPALRFMTVPRKLELAGLLDAEERRLCDELFDVNPLLFDFAVNRALRLVEDGETRRFPPSVFETSPLFGDSRLSGTVDFGCLSPKVDCPH
jgi:mannonate dehydratase